MKNERTPTDGHRLAPLRAMAPPVRALYMARHRAADALIKCGMGISADAVRVADPAANLPNVLTHTRRDLQALRSRLSDGSDEARYAAAGVALEALGRLWAAS